MTNLSPFNGCYKIDKKVIYCKAFSILSRLKIYGQVIVKNLVFSTVHSSTVTVN